MAEKSERKFDLTIRGEYLVFRPFCDTITFDSEEARNQWIEAHYKTKYSGFRFRDVHLIY